MKFRIGTVIMVVSCCAALSLTSCKKGEVKPAVGLQVVTTLFPLYDFARTIGGDKAQVKIGRAHV